MPDKQPIKKTIKLKFQNGLNFRAFSEEVFAIHGLTEAFEFVHSAQPDFIIFGPYGNDIPLKSDRYTRIGYFCENIKPDLSICEWAFGIPRENEIGHPNYKRIQWHGLKPEMLIKTLDDNEIDRIIQHKNKFCNFLYSNKVPYRETFFKQLGKYKKIDAPGSSMNNMASIDQIYPGNAWDRKRNFLSAYKFTIAFENYCYPGYQTEKLYDAMRSNSIPVYCGDPHIHEVFDAGSFINSADYMPRADSWPLKWLENVSQFNFRDYRPAYQTACTDRLRRKLKSIGKLAKMNLQFNQATCSSLIERIIALDEDQDLYVQCLKKPWFHGNRVPDRFSTKKRWTEIFEGSI